MAMFVRFENKNAMAFAAIGDGFAIQLLQAILESRT